MRNGKLLALGPPPDRLTAKCQTVSLPYMVMAVDEIRQEVEDQALSPRAPCISVDDSLLRLILDRLLLLTEFLLQKGKTLNKFTTERQS